MSHSVLRLFAAINFSRETKERLAALQSELRARSRRANFTLPENLHITLAFLGESDSRQTAAAKAAVASMRFAPFDVLIEGVACQKRERGNIWWASVNEGPALLDLQRRLTERLAVAGFEPEGRRYSPHITIARQVVAETAPWQIEPFGETVTQIHLMMSERVNGKLAYARLV